MTDQAHDPGPLRGDVTAQEPTRAEGLLARRIAESKATIPDVVLEADVDLEACLALQATSRAGDAPTLDDMLVRACGLALREHPRANGAYRDGAFELHGRVNVAIAVPSAGGQVAPTVFDADARSLAEVARAVRDLAARGAQGSLTAPELSGATFTVAALPPDVAPDRFTAVVPGGHAATLAAGAVRRVPVAVGDAVQVRHTRTLTLSCDGRILHGVVAAAFLARVRELLASADALA
jgi:pyruvate dehydrogenase E2 component (dihydrolipoamide acetyltransferase)